ncbi:MAG: L,D-transpeptidase family protein [Breznakibacter sp.]
MDKARVAIAEAQKSHSGKYSSTLFNEAVSGYDQAMQLWAKENDRIFFRRDYKKISDLAVKSEQKARLARERSLNNIASFEKRLKKRIAEIEKIILLYDRNFNRIPIDNYLTKKEAKARILFSEGKLAFNKKDYVVGAPKIDKAGEDIELVYNLSLKRIKEYFGKHEEWMKMAEKAIEESKRKSTQAILVDKFAGKCYLYDSGKLRHTWDAELGKNWVGEKKMKGDKATPEGHYRVIDKKAGRETIYYKALLINYPNDEDKQRFSISKKNGLIPRSAGIGNNIEIHGGGGRGANWTDGCVALANNDMDKIYYAVQVGTPVTIVGSLRPFHEVFKLD